MIGTLKIIVREWGPPILLRWIRKIRGGGVRFEGFYSTWEEASSRCAGYEADEILDKVLAATLQVKRGEVIFERDSVVFDQIEYAWPVLAGLMLAGARNDGNLNVLDFGGALGSSYFQNRKFLQLLKEVQWNVVEQPNFVDVGKQYIQDEQLKFYKSIEDCLIESLPNVILLSSVLQYLPDPFSVLNQLCAIKADVLIIDRTSFSLSDKQNIIRLQLVPKNIYKAVYPCRVFNEDNLREYIVKMGYRLIEDFSSLDNFDSGTYWGGHIYLKELDG